jgi:hypothetical protein
MFGLLTLPVSGILFVICIIADLTYGYFKRGLAVYNLVDYCLDDSYVCTADSLVAPQFIYEVSKVNFKHNVEKR